MAIDIMQAFTTEPPELDFIWGGFLAGTVGALVGPGGAGKSFFALEAAMAVACDVADGDVADIQTQRSGRVIYYAAEDPEPALIRRVHYIGKHIGTAARESIADNMTLLPIMGRAMDVMSDRQIEHMIKECNGARLVVLDTLSRVNARLDENSNGDMSRLVTRLEYVAVKTGASVLFIHHVSKGSARDGQTDQQAARGASALVDNARWCGYVASMTEDEALALGVDSDRRAYYARHGISKQNYGTIQPERWYERTDGGVLIPANLGSTKKHTGGGNERKPRKHA